MSEDNPPVPNTNQINYASESELSTGVITFGDDTYSIVRGDESTESGTFTYKPNGSTAYLELFETAPDVGAYEKHALIFTQADSGMFGGKTDNAADGVVSGKFQLVE